MPCFRACCVKLLFFRLPAREIAAAARSPTLLPRIYRSIFHVLRRPDFNAEIFIALARSPSFIRSTLMKRSNESHFSSLAVNNVIHHNIHTTYVFDYIFYHIYTIYDKNYIYKTIKQIDKSNEQSTSSNSMFLRQ